MRRVLFLTVAAALGVFTPTAAQQTPRTPALGSETARTTPPGPAVREAARVLPGTRTEVLTTIQGSALDSANGILPNTVVRLRDARYGRIVDTTMTDKAGVFTFRSVDPGSYVVELVGPDQSVVAASQILNVNAGEAVSALVKMPFKVPPYAGVLGHSTASALLVTSTAAASGVLATQVAGEQASPRR